MSRNNRRLGVEVNPQEGTTPGQEGNFPVSRAVSRCNRTGCYIVIFMALLSIQQAVFASISNAPADTVDSLNAQSALIQETIIKGEKFVTSGLYNLALTEWRLALKMYSKSPHSPGQVNLLYKIANAQRAVGMHRRSVRSLEVAHDLIKSMDDPLLQLRIETNLASAYLYAGDLDKARRRLEKLRVKARRLKQRRLEALILNDLGNLSAYQADYDTAQTFYLLCIGIADEFADKSILIKASINAASAAVQAGRLSEAAIHVESAVKYLIPGKADFSRAVSIVNAANIIDELSDQPGNINNDLILRIVQLLNTALIVADKFSNTRLKSQIYGVLASHYLGSGQQQDAMALNAKAIFAAQQANAPDLLYKWQWHAGRLYRKNGNLDDAIRSYRIAVNTLQPIRHQLSLKQIGKHSNYYKTQGHLYLELADLLLKKTDLLKDEDAISARLLEARDTVELQKEAELQDYFKDSCVVKAKSSVKTIDESLSPDTAVIYPILLPDRTELLVSYASGIRRYTIDKSESQVTDQVRQLRLELEKRRTRGYLAHARKLYDWLIKPIEADLKQKKIETLVFVADQSLRTIPISVLHDGSQFLINKYAVATTPGLKLTDSRPVKRDKYRVLLSGLSESVQGYPALKHVRGELEEIQDLYVGKLLLNRDFITGSLANELKDSNYSIAHIASHSVFTGDVKDSYILTFDGRITVDQLGEFAAIGRNREKPLDLITLSACQTAAGDDRAALGLAGVAIKAGARSALATLWLINDQASSLLVTEFYRQLLNNDISKARALQNAQTKLMQNVRYRHPGYWSPFLLIGNWL